MRTFIFQGNPDSFDIDGYMATSPHPVLWYVSHHAREMAVGDRVFLWRAAGKKRSPAGIIASATVIERPRLRPESEDAKPFWRGGDARGAVDEMRASLRLDAVAPSGGVLPAELLKSDPVLRDLPNLRFLSKTTYLVPAAMAAHLAAVWEAAAPLELRVSVPEEALERSDEVARHLARTTSTAELRRLYDEYASRRPAGPSTRVAAVRIYQRAEIVKAYALDRAKNRCELPGCTVLPFLMDDETAYCEVHHIVPLAEGGPDIEENVACLCPAHHREAHCGKQRDAIRSQLQALRRGASPGGGKP
ncbi:EVE domain-containing protein [Phreatobacter sp.]|uniref:HNH endonuclease n=1 Tax=Phreatobacter sp. TaxID=1966341 RepID=UPI0025F82A87|nr:EVE domain-containing protein [Phreatobacter sp.]